MNQTARLVLAATLCAALAVPARATSLHRARTAHGVDWVSAGIGGVSGDTAHIAVTGVTGPVRAAYLYWDGMAIDGVDEVYDNPSVALDGNVVTGTSLGDTSSNCWGDGASTAYVADVTPYVGGNATYALSGLMAQPAHQPNGASLVVLYDDGDPTNDHDLVFFEGDDSTHGDHFPGHEDNAWHAQFDDVVYQRGSVNIQLHVADGQSPADGALTFRTTDRTLTIPDTAALFDGKSVPLEGTSRSPGDALWDIHTFDITSLFHAHGTFTFWLDTPTKPPDCIALVAAIVETAAEPVPVCGDGTVTAPEECDDGNTRDGDCCDSTCHFEAAGTVCGNPGDPCLESRCDGKGGCDAEGRSCTMPAAPHAGMLALQTGRRDQLAWRWNQGIAGKADFGNPLDDTDYDLCVLDKGTGSIRVIAHTTVPGGEDCAGKPCWKETATGFEYRNPVAPLQQLSLQGGLPGRARIVARTLGTELVLPRLPLAPPVLVRLHASNGACWGVNYTLPQTNARRAFRAQGDFFYP